MDFIIEFIIEVLRYFIML